MEKLQRWYKGFFCVNGNKRKLKYQIAEVHDLTELTLGVPVVHEEYGVGRYQGVVTLKVNEREDKYLTLEYATYGKLYLPLSSLHLISRFISIDPEQTPLLHRLKGREKTNFEIYETHTHTIPYQPKQVSYDNPFDFMASSNSERSLPDDGKDFSHQYERLLYWLSALGAGSWESFKKACQSLELTEPKRILRRLKLLGHLESSADGLKWSMSPIALVKVSSQSESQEFVLCGQRSLKLMQRLEQLATVISKNQADAPPCIHIQLAHSENVSDLIEQINAEFSIIDAGDASRQLAHIFPDIINWKQGLRRLPGIKPSLYEWKRFNGDEFVDGIFEGEPGMYQMWPMAETDRPHYTLFYDPESEGWLQGDWYGLRFLALQHAKIHAQYDRATERLAIPAQLRWPELYERALVLASGQLPTRENSWLLYDKVGLEVVRQLTTKLNVKCELESDYA